MAYPEYDAFVVKLQALLDEHCTDVQAASTNGDVQCVYLAKHNGQGISMAVSIATY